MTSSARRALVGSLERRGVLAADFDGQQEQERIREQGADPDSGDLDAARTPPLRVAAEPRRSLAV